MQNDKTGKEYIFSQEYSQSKTLHFYSSFLTFDLCCFIPSFLHLKRKKHYILVQSLWFALLPETVHVPHLSVEHWKESKEEVKSDDIGEVESKIPLVWKQNWKLFSLLKEWNISQCNYSFTNKAQGVKWNPNCVSAIL